MYLLSVSENSDEFRGKARVLHQVIKGGGPTRVTQSSCPTNPTKKAIKLSKSARSFQCGAMKKKTVCNVLVSNCYCIHYPA